MKRAIILGLSFLALASCSASTSGTSVMTEKPAPPAPNSAIRAEIASDSSAGSNDGAEQKVAGENVQSPEQNNGAINIRPMLAYAYSVSFLLPQNKVEAQMKAHQQACETAGLNKCQVISASINNDEANISANLSIRAEPTWLATFRGNFQKDAQNSGGRITQNNVTSQDLTREITDTEARLRALNALRTRLEAIIATRPGKLSDLLDAERELARVQGDIDSFNSNLAVAKARVDMSVIDLNYVSRPDAVNNSALEPLKQSFLNFFRNIVSGFAAVLDIISTLLPFALVFGPLGWFGWKFFKNRKVKKEEKKVEDKI